MSIWPESKQCQREAGLSFMERGIDVAGYRQIDYSVPTVSPLISTLWHADQRPTNKPPTCSTVISICLNNPGTNSRFRKPSCINFHFVPITFDERFLRMRQETRS